MTIKSPKFLSFIVIGMMVLPLASTAMGKPKRVALVRHVGSSGKGDYAVVDSGSKSGYVVGLDICFYDTEDRERGCGVIEHTNSKAAGIRLKKGTADSVTEGQRAWHMKWGPLPSLDGLEEVDHSSAVDALVQDEQEEPEDPPELKRRLSVSYLVAPKVPVTVRGLGFNATARSSGSGSVWASGEESTKSLMGLGVGLHWPKPGPWETLYGFAYHFVSQNQLKTDYDLTDGTYVESGVTGHFYRFHVLKGYALWKNESLQWMVHLGGELLVANYRFSATHKDSSSLAQGTMVATCFDLPIGTSVTWKIGGWTFLNGFEVLPPLFMRAQTSGVVGYQESTSASKDIPDIHDALDPKKKIGFVVKIGLAGEF
jgi:hypothetical protein